MMDRQTIAGKTSRRLARKPLAAGVCLAAASVFGGSLVVDAVGTAPIAASLTAAEAEVFAGIDPLRLLDTRNGVGADSAGQFGPGETRTLVVGGINGIPADATSVALNVTIPRSASTTSFVTVWPTGIPQPATSTNNATPGQAVPNFTITALGTGGAIEVFNERGNTDIVIDIVGYYVALDSVSGTGGGTGIGSGLETSNGPPNDADGGAEGDLVFDSSTGDVYRFDGDVFVLVGNTAPPRAGGSTADSPVEIDVPLLTVLDDPPGPGVVVGSVTGLPTGTYDASATVDLAIDVDGVLGVGVGIQARCWWSNAVDVIFTTSLTANVGVVGLDLPGVATGSITVPGTLGGDADLVCDAGATVALVANIDVRSVDISAVRVGDVGSVEL